MPYSIINDNIEAYNVFFGHYLGANSGALEYIVYYSNYYTIISN